MLRALKEASSTTCCVKYVWASSSPPGRHPSLSSPLQQRLHHSHFDFQEKSFRGTSGADVYLHTPNKPVLAKATEARERLWGQSKDVLNCKWQIKKRLRGEQMENASADILTELESDGRGAAGVWTAYE